MRKLSLDVQNRPRREQLTSDLSASKFPTARDSRLHGFGVEAVRPDRAKLCFDRKLTVADIREIHRAAATTATKEKNCLANVFPTATEVATRHFVIEWRAVEFGPRYEEVS